MPDYTSIHSRLVATTPAYQDLLATLAATGAELDLPDGTRWAVPCSTGEFVEAMAGVGGAWELRDYDETVRKRALAHLQALGMAVHDAHVDFETSEAIGDGEAALILCVHALHIVEAPRQDLVLQQMADGLAPGGAVVLVGFCRQEWLPMTLWRVARHEGGLRAAWELAPWRFADVLAHFAFDFNVRRPPEVLQAALRATGLEVSEPTSVFKGCSTLLVGRKPAS